MGSSANRKDSKKKSLWSSMNHARPRDKLKIELDQQLSSYMVYHSNLFHQTKFKRSYIQYESIVERILLEHKTSGLGELVKQLRDVCHARKDDESLISMSPGFSEQGDTFDTLQKTVVELERSSQDARVQHRYNSTASEEWSGNASRFPKPQAVSRISTYGSLDEYEFAPDHPILNVLYNDVLSVHKCYVDRVSHMKKWLHHIERALGETELLQDDDEYEAIDDDDSISELQDDRSKVKKFIKKTYNNCRFIESFCQLNITALKEICSQLHTAQLIYFEMEKGMSPDQLLDKSLPYNALTGSDTVQILTSKSIYHHFTNLSPFSNTKRIDDVMSRLHELYAHHFCGSNYDKAFNQLSKTYIKHNKKDIFKVAFGMGFLLPILVLVIGLLFLRPSTIDIHGFWDVFPIFRALLLIILYMWFFGLDVYIWQRNKVNHMYILELQPSATLDHVKIFKTAAIFTCVWLVYFALYLGHAKEKVDIIPIDVKWYPLGAIVTLFIMCLCPFHIFHLGARTTIFKVILNLIVTPFGKCRFVENFAADILTSMAIPLSDVSYTICYYLSGAWNEHSELNKCSEWTSLLGPCLSFWPYYWRFMQCIRAYHDTRQKPQLVNAVKYVSSLAVIVLNALHSNIESSQQWGVFRIIWIITVIASTLYAYSWDVTMDWGLLKIHQKTLLRKRYIFPRLFYAGLAIFNLFARFAWAGTLATYISNRMYFMKIVFGAIEISRRAMWSIVRLEWAQISNAEKYRKSRFVPQMIYHPVEDGKQQGNF